MIDPKLLTVENGFVLNETAVEYTREGFRPTVGIFGVRVSELTDLESIRPLTGPMAIWNHAPEWANSCLVDFDSVTWFTGPGYTPKEDCGICYTRPFWAKKES